MKRKNLTAVFDTLGHLEQTFRRAYGPAIVVPGYLGGSLDLSSARGTSTRDIGFSVEPNTSNFKNLNQMNVIARILARKCVAEGRPPEDWREELDRVMADLQHEYPHIPRKNVTTYGSPKDPNFVRDVEVIDLTKKKDPIALLVPFEDNLIDPLINRISYSNSYIESENLGDTVDMSKPVLCGGVYSQRFNTVVYLPNINRDKATNLKIDTGKILYIEEIPFCGRFVGALLELDLLKYLMGTFFAPLYKAVLESTSVSDTTKETIVTARYLILDLIDEISGNLSSEKEIINLITNKKSLTTEAIIRDELRKLLNARGTQEKYRALNDARFEQLRATSPEAVNSINASAVQQTPEMKKLNVASFYYDLSCQLTSLAQIYTLNMDPNLPTPPEQIQDTAVKFDLLYDILIKFLYKGEKINAADMEKLLHEKAAYDLLYASREIIRSLSLNYYSFMLSPRIERSTPSKSEQYLRIKTHNVINNSLHNMLYFSDIDIADFSKQIGKIVSKYKNLEPGSAGKIKKKSVFVSFVEDAGLAYDTEGMDDIENSAKIKRILNRAAADIAKIAGTAERAEPGDTVAQAMRAVVDDEEVLDRVYGVLDKAVNSCYDIVFGPDSALEDSGE